MFARAVVVSGALALVAACGRVGFEGTAIIGDDDGEDGLVLAPAIATINVGSRVELVASGGEPPYTYALAGDGMLSGTTFLAPTHAGESAVTVADARGRMAGATIRYAGDRLFLVGGFAGASPVPDVFASTDGVTWTPAGALPAARANGALVVFDDRMFYMGGLNAAGSPTNDVFASTDGASWTRVGALPATNTGFTSVVHRGAMWIVGGATGGGDGVDAYSSTDGATWTFASRITGPRHEHDLVSHGGALYVIGGHGNGLLDDVQSTTDGTAWSAPLAALTFVTDFGAAARLGDRVFRTCGSGCTDTESSTDLVTWTPGAALPAQREGPALVGFGGRLLVVGGGGDVLATTDGASWTQVGMLPGSRTRTAAVQFTPP